MIVHRPQSDHLFRDSQLINNRYSVIDFSLIQRLLVATGVGIVLSQRRGKVVHAREVLLGTHVEIVMACVVEYGIQSDRGGDTDGAWRESLVEVGVVG